jgi:ferric-dicitrate binding protein FerR (iron transport regulator)
MDRTQLLVSEYLDDELTSDEREQLATTLETDGVAVDRLVLHSFIHAQLLDWMTTPNELPAAAPAPRLYRGPSRIGRRSFGLIAATLLLAAGVFWLAYLFAWRPVIVGQLTHAAGCRWASTQPALSVGALLRDGQDLELLKGTALVTLVSGAQLQLEGPTSVRLASAMEAHLRQGRIAAKVPTTARGFTVTSSLARFVDLGTAFMLSLEADKSFVLHVFEGLVELQLDERFGKAAHQPLRVAEVRAVTFDAASGEITAPQFEEGKQMPF